MKIFHVILAVLIYVATPAFAQDELLASKTSPQFATLRPLTNGLSALSLMWPLNSLAENRIEASHAGLATIVGGSTRKMSAFEAETYREINGISFGITTLPQHIMLTITVPDNTFKDGLAHLHALLSSTEFSRPWYARQSVQQRPLLATKSRRPSNVVGVLLDFMLFPEEDNGTDVSHLTFRFGMPSHVVLRAKEESARSAVNALLRGLPVHPKEVAYPTLVTTDLPKGVIFAPDPNSLETLMYVIKSETFADETDMVGANLLMDYIGANQGSEMFRVIRQELRAAYSPASDFEQIGKNRAVMGMSATVVSQEWPKILSELEGIYTRVRDGEATDQGLNNNKRRLINGLEHQFATNARWGATQYMNEYTNGASGQIKFPMFGAIVNADFKKARKNAVDHLPPFDDYLVILIGGTVPPPEAMKANGYCEQPLSKPLRYCLTQLR